MSPSPDTESRAPWPRPEVVVDGWVSPLEPWVVTACDAAFFPWLAAFVGSLRDVAGYSGPIAVVDYGLKPKQLASLAHAAVERIPAAGRRNRVLDRYFTIAEAFPPPSRAVVAHFDADVWFHGPIDDLLAQTELRAGRLGATIDVITCDYYFRCSSPDRHDEVRRLLSEVRAAFGESLQAGVIVGTPAAWSLYTRTIEKLLDEGFARDGWGTDALALNLLARDRPDDFALLPITYNAPPLWGLQREGDALYAMEPGGNRSSHQDRKRVPIVAIHRTSGVRGIRNRDLPFAELHPDVAARWARRFDVEMP